MKKVRRSFLITSILAVVLSKNSPTEAQSNKPISLEDVFQIYNTCVTSQFKDPVQTDGKKVYISLKASLEICDPLLDPKFGLTKVRLERQILVDGPEVGTFQLSAPKPSTKQKIYSFNRTDSCEECSWHQSQIEKLEKLAAETVSKAEEICSDDQYKEDGKCKNICDPGKIRDRPLDKCVSCEERFSRRYAYLYEKRKLHAPLKYHIEDGTCLDENNCEFGFIWDPAVSHCTEICPLGSEYKEGKGCFVTMESCDESRDTYLHHSTFEDPENINEILTAGCDIRPLLQKKRNNFATDVVNTFACHKTNNAVKDEPVIYSDRPQYFRAEDIYNYCKQQGIKLDPGLIDTNWTYPLENN